MFKLGAPSCDTGIQELPEIAHYARAYFYFLPKFGVSNNVKQFSLSISLIWMRLKWLKWLYRFVYVIMLLKIIPDI